MVENLPSERKLPTGKVQNKVKKKTNNSAFSATYTHIKLTLVSFVLLFFILHLPLKRALWGTSSPKKVSQTIWARFKNFSVLASKC